MMALCYICMILILKNMKKNILLGMLFFSLPIFSQVDRHHIDVAKNLDIFNAVYKQLDMMYVDTLDAHEIISYGIDAMLSETMK